MSHYPSDRKKGKVNIYKTRSRYPSYRVIYLFRPFDFIRYSRARIKARIRGKEKLEEN